MAEVKWIKLYIDIFDNRKIKQIETLPDGDTILVIWLKLLTLAGNINDGGLVYFTKDIPYTEEMLATQLNRPLQTVKLALNVFERFGMIETTNDVLKVSNWERHQSIEGMERIREQTRQRVANYRERQKQIPGGCNVTVTQSNGIDKKRKDKKRDIIAADEMQYEEVDLDKLRERIYGKCEKNI